ncbi:RNA polymerase sigma-54 factor [Romboutsia maritimum]|uniref:RNA polymerase sigma-54 factor n=1 Tax=Romboutsia maritimum TaxID=2020948 RepID=A0A371IV82_9FIRM|nr:RNA polymerase factor sigma-54 [Romboutsia maritimum]RDY24393.1 RNA polymerase sigma-54 factor [Romboutsia maritimum]
MNFNQSLELTQSQKLIITTQLKQSLTILNMSKLELDEEIKKEAEDNPLIEVEKRSEINWEDYIKDIENLKYTYQNKTNYNPDSDFNLENMIKYSSNLYEDLKFQISLYKMSNEKKRVCDYIIDSLDEDGYLRIDENELIKELSTDKKTFTECLENIQQLEPIGVGARDISECLIIQMKNLGIYNEILGEIVVNDLNLIAKNKYKEITKKYNIPLQRCVSLINIIKNLNPKPGRLCSTEKSVYIQPDVIVEKFDNEFITYINEKDGCNIKINNFYKEILKNSQSDKNAKEFIKEKLNSAAELVKNIESRKSTVLKIAQEIVNTQDDFFRRGTMYIKPLKMKDIAEKLEFHESTISRGVNGKYMLTPFGLYEFRYFFSSAIETQDSGMASSTSIKKIIKEIIKDENKKKPLSDEQISKILKEEGFNIARRTVAKYREELGILSSSRRKEY